MFHVGRTKSTHQPRGLQSLPPPPSPKILCRFLSSPRKKEGGRCVEYHASPFGSRRPTVGHVPFDLRGNPGNGTTARFLCKLGDFLNGALVFVFPALACFFRWRHVCLPNFVFVLLKKLRLYLLRNHPGTIHRPLLRLEHPLYQLLLCECSHFNSSQ